MGRAGFPLVFVMRFPFRKNLRPVARPSRAGKTRRKKGQTLVEYALILAIVAIACIGAFSLLSNQVILVFSRITSLLDTAQTYH
jgi:Flp pilus assembly pilin Flp